MTFIEMSAGSPTSHSTMDDDSTKNSSTTTIAYNIPSRPRPSDVLRKDPPLRQSTSQVTPQYSHQQVIPREQDLVGLPFATTLLNLSSPAIPKTPQRLPNPMNSLFSDFTTMSPPPSPSVGPSSPPIPATPQYFIDQLNELRTKEHSTVIPVSRPVSRPGYIHEEPTINPQLLLTIKSVDLDISAPPDTLRNPGVFYFITSHYYSPTWVSYHLPTSRLAGSGILEHHTWYLNIDSIPTITESWLPARDSNIPRVAQYSRGGRSVQGIIFRLSKEDADALHRRPEVQSGDLTRQRKMVRINKAPLAQDYGKNIEVILYTPVRETRPMVQPLDKHQRIMWVEGVREAIFHRCISAEWASQALQPWLGATLPKK